MRPISVKGALAPIILCVLALVAIGSLRAEEPRRVGVLLDEAAVVPMRVEADIIAELAGDIVGEFNASAPDSFALDLLVPTETGAVRRDGTGANLDDYDALLVYQGDEIKQDTALFSEGCVAALKKFSSADGRGLVLVGGSVALIDRLWDGATQKAAPLTFGEDRAQAGVEPISPSAKVYEGVDLDRGVAWITNAAFPAFASFDVQGIEAIGNSLVEGKPNPFYLAANWTDDKIFAKIFVFGWRVSPLYDSAPETYKENFKRLLANMLKTAGGEIALGDLTAPKYVAPNFDALERALDYCEENFDEEEFPKGEEFRARLGELREKSSQLETSANSSDAEGLGEQSEALASEFAALQKEVLLASPELDFDEFFYIRRDPNQMGLPENYNSNSVLPPLGYENELCRLNLRDGSNAVVYKPSNGEFIGDLELYYDASKIMFSSPDVSAENRWRLWELSLDENGDAAGDGSPELEKLINEVDVDNYDGCYLPDDRVIFCSTATMTGVPCINGKGHVCNLYIKELDGSIRQLTLEQDHDWNPVVMNNGRVMYLRWEYVDLPHCFSRIMFHMNPDGTNQSELYGSGSYYPNSLFYARPLPGDSGKFVGIVTGHHEQNRVGDMVIFDPSQGRKEATGAVQRVPGYGKKVEPIACDLPIAQSWPKFIHPFPISETLFLVSCKRGPDKPWEICLVDVFDNIVPLASEPERALLEPVPLRETERQPILADRVAPESPTADVFIADVYEGEGLKGVPRGEVKSLRVFSYQFAYQGMGAEPYSVGLDGPWDPRRIIGTVPVQEDGSAAFKIPAYVPIALQPLDKDGKAIQIMRSWITALPGESVSCIGCHEPQNSTATTNPRTTAAQIEPIEIEPFYGETRGFGFEREIQPILDRYCVECHSPDSEKVASLIAEGKVSEEVLQSEKRPNETFELSRLPDFRKSAPKCVLDKGNYIAVKSPVSNAYYQLRRFVNTVTKESQMPTHRPYEFHADTEPLVQLLTDGHWGVELDPESWDKLVTWIDLNCPYNGSWGEMVRDNPALVKSQFSRREELRQLYAPSSEQLDDDPNAKVEASAPNSTLRVQFSSEIKSGSALDAQIRTEGEQTFERVSLGEGVELEMVSLPGAGFDVGRYEITNEQYKVYDPTFDSGIEYGDFIQFSPGERGWLLSRKNQPVCRITQKDAEAFCQWLSEKTGDKYRLPTLEERKLFSADGDNPFWFGDLTTDYSAFENLGDSSRGKISPFGWTGRVETLPGWRPVDWTVDDHSRVSAPVGSYKPNRYWLYDVDGNVAEWTSSERVDVRKVVDEATGETVEEESTVKKIAAGGSWTTPARAAANGSIRAYPAHYNLRDVGFRVVREKR
ncbi:MAG: SUMF1/EgtB/PvdO family nonheme iron enzyme [Thermoguttaceae bacterium]|nr:SUMF1/EgtB/PvdO family nonheme iron enzyme [Thermoguttaceae bacterium]